MIHTLKISPCPNDTFAFYALLHNKIETRGLKVEVEFHDIETLNKAILKQQGDIIKASIAIASKVATNYQLLNSGAALGRGNGPIVVCNPSPESCKNQKVALAGENTTATLLFNRYFKGYTPLYTKFNQIAQMVESGEVELGVLIHEGRFTFQEYGLEKVIDLGEKWERESGMPLPLGGIYARRGLDVKLIESVIQDSVKWAMAHPSEPLDFVRQYASELSPEVMQNHIEYFVNQYTIELSNEGQVAINSLCQSNIFS